MCYRTISLIFRLGSSECRSWTNSSQGLSGTKAIKFHLEHLLQHTLAIGRPLKLWYPCIMRSFSPSMWSTCLYILCLFSSRTWVIKDMQPPLVALVHLILTTVISWSGSITMLLTFWNANFWIPFTNWIFQRKPNVCVLQYVFPAPNCEILD